ncbi:chymotrypsinogen B isoform X2 [Nematostella vectensis]|nr:chymotrypsinogen B isoform X2 [Nematostella vectensis]
MGLLGILLFSSLTICVLPELGSTCGQRPGWTRIVGGHDAAPHSWPWQVSLREELGHTCGGTLIAPEWVVTATHCIIMNPSPSSYTVALGAHRRLSSNTAEQVIKVKRIFKHSGFSMWRYRDDIALLQLERPAQLNDRVNVACLPSPGDVPPVGSKCWLTGWGRQVDSSGPLPDILQQARIPIASHEDCKRKYGSGIYSYTHLCAGEAKPNAAGACQGDSGGPLVCERNGQWTLYGVVSFGAGNCEVTSYTVYTKVSNYLDWITKRAGNLGVVGTYPPLMTSLPPVTTRRTAEPSTPKPTSAPTKPNPTTRPDSGCVDKATNCKTAVSMCYSPTVKRYCVKTCSAC